MAEGHVPSIPDSQHKLLQFWLLELPTSTDFEWIHAATITATQVTTIVAAFVLNP
jgi:hypothetical protein